MRPRCVSGHCVLFMFDQSIMCRVSYGLFCKVNCVGHRPRVSYERNSSPAWKTTYHLTLVGKANQIPSGGVQPQCHLGNRSEVSRGSHVHTLIHSLLLSLLIRGKNKETTGGRTPLPRQTTARHDSSYGLSFYEQEERGAGWQGEATKKDIFFFFKSTHSIVESSNKIHPISFFTFDVTIQCNTSRQKWVIVYLINQICSGKIHFTFTLI